MQSVKYYQETIFQSAKAAFELTIEIGNLTEKVQDINTKIIHKQYAPSGFPELEEARRTLNTTIAQTRHKLEQVNRVCLHAQQQLNNQ